MTRITSVRYTRAHTNDGLLGWVSFILDGSLLIDGVALRRSRHEELVFSWPGRKGRAGKVHHHVRPIGERERNQVEGQLLEHLFPLLQDGAA